LVGRVANKKLREVSRKRTCVNSVKHFHPIDIDDFRITTLDQNNVIPRRKPSRARINKNPLRGLITTPRRIPVNRQGFLI
jgi:hypothetical protein